MVQPYISAATAERVKDAQRRLFATNKLLGRTVLLTLYRDVDNDGIAGPIGPQQVLVVMARREATQQRGPATLLGEMDGELRKEAPFDVQHGDRFTLPEGISGRVSTPPIDTGIYIRAPFVLEA